MQGFTVEGSNLPAGRGGPGFPHLRVRLKHWNRGNGILDGRDRRELRWVAAMMSQALEKAARQNPLPSPDVVEQPAGGRAI